MNNILRERIDECLNTLRTTDLKKVHRYLTETLLAKDSPQDEVTCPWCGSSLVIKFGMRNGKQRYRCHNNDCGKTFTTSTHTVMYHSQLSQEIWMEFLMDTLEGRSLDYSAHRLGFSHQTAFNLRHKILTALEAILELNPTTLTEIAELDETYVPDNYKGTPLPDDVGRAPRKRGGKAALRGISEKQICICTGVQRNGPVMARTVNRATPSKDEISQVFSGHIGPETLVLTDGGRSYNVLKSAIEGCSIVNVKKTDGGAYHLNTVNNFHSFIKRWYSTFRGVATKYLNRYNGFFCVAYRKAKDIVSMLQASVEKASTISYWTPVSALKLQQVLVLAPTTA